MIHVISKLKFWCLPLSVILSCYGLNALAQGGSRYDAHYAAAPWVGETLSGTACEPAVKGGYGPYDYTRRAAYKNQLEVVEQAHFFPQVEHLKYSLTLITNIDYTLRAWPNHHRALNSLIRASLDDGYRSLTKKFPPAECYLQRAVNYSPRDGIAHMLYGMYLQRSGHPRKALPLYKKAEELKPRDTLIKYNTGLLMVELGDYEEAKRYADIVYGVNFPLQGLRRQLSEKGYSVEEPNQNSSVKSTDVQ